MRRNLYASVALVPLAILSAHMSWAQVTTSAMNGIITDKSGEGLPGATVIAVHTPTNTQYVAPTNSEGRFNIQGMRVGGPYTVRITFVGYQDATRENLFLSLGQNLRLDINLSESSQQLGEVVVSGRRDALINSDRVGSVTAVQREQIERLPSITRSLNDITRLTPQSNGQNIGGGNNRQNNFTVDGSDFNNNFGIGGNLPANGTPISLDAIEQLTVSVTPYDVRQSGFVGGAINAVTRSGTNDISGSVYGYFRNDKFIGDRVGNERVPLQDSRFYQYGFRLGGPIIKDKLFFFANAEIEENRTPGQTRFAATAAAPYGSATNITRPTAGELDEISNYLSTRFGYETGGYQGYDFTSPRTKFLGRIDWNISKNHRFNIRYNQTEGKTPSFPSTSSSPLTNFAFGAGRTDLNALPFRYAGYFQEANFYSAAAELNSTFGGNMTNTLRATYTKQNDPRSSDSRIFPFVDILKADGTNAPTPFTSFGYEPFTLGNLRDVAIYSVRDDFSWLIGRHNITLGGQADYSITKNGFQRFAASYYRFNSFADFQTASNPNSTPAQLAAARPTDFAYTYSLSPGFEQAFPTFKFGQYSLYAQDDYSIRENLRLLVGVRADYVTYPEKLKEHPLVSALNFANNEKINVANLPKSSILFSPRVGFNWDVNNDQTVQLRGGTGIFTGRVPYVWIVSQAGDAGLLQITRTFSGSAIDQLPGGYRGFNEDPGFYRPATVPAAGTVIPNVISAVDQNFKFPQTLKSSLGVDAKLPGGFVASLEGIYNKDLNTAIFRNANLVEPRNLGVSGYPDSRLIYPNNNQDKFLNPINGAGQAVPNGTAGGGAFNAIVLDNANKGYYWSLTGKLERQFDNGLYASVAYTRSDARNLYDGGGDQPLSAWQQTPTVNGSNNLQLSYASYVVPDRVIASVSYKREYLKNLATTLSVFYEGSQQGRFSYVYSADFNRDGGNADLIYIPRDASEINFVSQTVGTGSSAVTYTPQQQSDLFFKYIEQDKYLRDRKGTYAERNGALLPWRNQVDVKLLQDIFTNIGNKRNTLQLSLDIFNIGNLINSDWGLINVTNASSVLVPTNVSSLTPGGTTRPTFRLQLDRGGLVQETFRRNLSVSSTYYMQVGVRYIFN
ncbi:outer membrane receptor protein involved in Fe transport [Hymenobacter luteus]|uniref:Outer membrane receptor protein involved in Fe transport n=2 Tax=Hymenobacter TaxID=89966 RepID=A0A7W9T0K7_9BACT|nr:MULTISPECIES: carboxypeptidase regulatory-like domain-containing protein [Hymenobacter]MBB4600592.1 outer membrane receptor protein involved in Fe transport [Hymenobacter latericoloratus]MBB6059201.1 outer membrane receptor protein involved in Fe transport [Hymenobacter luteus]